MKRGTTAGEQLATASQVKRVVGVAPVRRAATARDDAISAQTTEVVGDEALRQVEQGAKLADSAVAMSKRDQQPPAQGMPGESQKARRGELRAGCRRRRHTKKNRSKWFDVSSRRRS